MTPLKLQSSRSTRSSSAVTLFRPSDLLNLKRCALSLLAHHSFGIPYQPLSVNPQLNLSHADSHWPETVFTDTLKHTYSLIHIHHNLLSNIHMTTIRTRPLSSNGLSIYITHCVHTASFLFLTGNACQGASELVSYCMVSRLYLGAWQCIYLLTYLLIISIEQL